MEQLKIIKDLAKKKKLEIYLVGGYLRELMLDKNSLDYDFAVSKNAIKLAEQFANRIKGAFVLLDKERGCARVVKKHGNEISTYDFADFRADSFKKDLSHRDFTINTMSIDLFLLDFKSALKPQVCDHKKGLKDLNDKRIKLVSVKAFKDDPLRMLRAYSLQAVLGFQIDPKTQDQIQKDKALLLEVSPERVREEFFKILNSNRTAETIKAMDHIGLLEQVIPQIRVMYGCKQGGYHHLDVWPHSIEVLVQMEKIFENMKDQEDVEAYVNETISGNHTRKALMKFAALLHDIGKPDTRKREGERLSFHAHERVGKNITKIIAKMLKLSTRERHDLENMVLWHLRPGYLSNFKSPSERMIFRYFRDTKEEGASILLLSLADQRSTRGPLTSQVDQDHHEDICLDLLDRFFEKKKEKPFVCLINGNDILKKLKVKPSPLIGEILREVEERQVLGKIKTKKEALDIAVNLAAKN